MEKDQSSKGETRAALDTFVDYIKAREGVDDLIPWRVDRYWVVGSLPLVYLASFVLLYACMFVVGISHTEQHVLLLHLVYLNIFDHIFSSPFLLTSIKSLFLTALGMRLDLHFVVIIKTVVTTVGNI